MAAYVAAGLVVLATATNLAMGLGAEPNWFKVGTLLLTVPAMVLIGQRFARQG